MNTDLQAKLQVLNAQLLALTGSSGADVLDEMGTDAANAYLRGCQQLAAEALALASAG